MNLNLNLITSLKMGQRSIYVKHKIIKFLKRNTEDNLHDLELGKELLVVTSKSQPKMNFIKM